MSVAIMISPGSTGIDEPPGIQALSLRPARMPPAISSSLANGVPSRTSKLPGCATSPQTEKIFVPPLLGRSRSRNASPPLRRIHGPAAKVSVLSVDVGLPYRALLAGHVGLQLGKPF